MANLVRMSTKEVKQEISHFVDDISIIVDAGNYLAVNKKFKKYRNVQDYMVKNTYVLTPIPLEEFKKKALMHDLPMYEYSISEQLRSSNKYYNAFFDLITGRIISAKKENKKKIYLGLFDNLIDENIRIINWLDSNGIKFATTDSQYAEPRIGPKGTNTLVLTFPKEKLCRKIKRKSK